MDAVGLHAPCRQDERGYLEADFQASSGDPSVLAGAIAYVTSHIGIGFTASILQEHPFQFARRLSTLDHASRGRIAWNIIPDDPPDAWADEYVDVTFKLWEGSWEEDALRQDRRSGSSSATATGCPSGIPPPVTAARSRE
jgi:alkanesulfonate monooxygenase SsuD/methylene tetrahydromethanopterin reductase-like flavin-dependent oxidoreductase (luciferase family)